MTFREILMGREPVDWREVKVYERELSASLDRMLDLAGFDGVEGVSFMHPRTKEGVAFFVDGDRMLLVENKKIGRREYARISEWRKQDVDGTA